MNKVVILTDSTCDLDLNIIQEKNINVIPLYVCFGDKNYKDGVDINTEKLYEMVEELGYLPKTSAVSPNEFINFFAPFIDKGYDIVYLGIGSTLSSTFNNAYIASLSFPENRIFLIDSLNLSTGTGLLVLKACKYRDQNFSAAESSNFSPDFVISFITVNNIAKIAKYPIKSEFATVDVNISKNIFSPINQSIVLRKKLFS